jgi:hypothetical protein
MKNLILVLSVILSFNSFSQKEVSSKLAKSSFETSGLGNGWEIIQKIKNDKDTTIFFYMSYQNMKYSHITDIGSVFYTRKADLLKFAQVLLEFSKYDSGTAISQQLGTTSLDLYDFSNSIYIEDNNGKYTTITKRKAEELANQIIENAHFLIR